MEKVPRREGRVKGRLVCVEPFANAAEAACYSRLQLRPAFLAR